MTGLAPGASGPRHLLHVFSTFRVGGPQVRFADLANRFGGRYRHSIIALDGAYDCRERLRPELEVEIVPAPQSSFLADRLWRIGRALRKARPDLLVTYNWGSIEWGIVNLAVRIPQLHIEDGFLPGEAVRQFRRRVWARRFVFRRHARVLVPSRTLYRIATETWRLPPARVLHVPNGIDTARFGSPPREHRRFAWGVPPGRPVVGTVAALRTEKALDRLLRAFAAVGHAFEGDSVPHLVIVGEGPERPTLEALAAMLGMAERVTFAGHEADPAEAFKAFDLFALSSDTEQMPYGVLEAMASGLPIAAVDVGDIGEMVTAENAPFVVPKDVDALSAAIGRLLAEPALGRAIGEANRRRVQDLYGIDRMAAAYDRLFAGALPA